MQIIILIDSYRPRAQRGLFDFLAPKGLMVVSDREMCQVNGTERLTKFFWAIFEL